MVGPVVLNESAMESLRIILLLADVDHLVFLAVLFIKESAHLFSIIAVDFLASILSREAHDNDTIRDVR